MDDAGDVDVALVGVPVYADVFLLGAGEGEVEDVFALVLEDVEGGGEVVGVLGRRTIGVEPLADVLREGVVG